MVLFKRSALLFVLLVTGFIAKTQGVYQRIPIVNDTVAQWSAASSKLVNLASSTQSLKKFYLDKIRTKGITAYSINPATGYANPYQLNLPSLGVQDWLKGLGVETPETKSRKEWYFYDKTMPKENYDRFRYRAGAGISTDSCCGCDEADAFRVQQVLNYRNGKFSIYNEWISPLCARQAKTSLLEWYPLCDVAYAKPGKAFPGKGNGVVYLTQDVVDYEFGNRFPSPDDSVLLTDRSDIGSLIYADILKGNLRPVNIETGKPLDIKKLLTLGMAVDTVMEMDENGNVSRYLAVQSERSPSEFSRLRITQDFYFDFTNERLYSVVRSVVIVSTILGYDGSVRGYSPFCRLEN